MNLSCLSLVLDCSLYTVNIIAKFMLGVENGFNCETNSWQTRRLLNPLSPPKSRLCPLSSNSTQGFIPKLLCFEKKCPSILSVAYISHQGTASESLCAHGWRTENERLWEVFVVDGERRSIPEQTLIHWRSWLKWLTSSHSAVFQNGTQDEHMTFVGLYFLKLCTCLFFFFFFLLFLSFHIYSWRIFKPFFKNMLVNEFLRLTNSCFFGIF